jgi:hypothetical protein
MLDSADYGGQRISARRRPDDRRVAFMSNSFGDATLIDLQRAASSMQFRSLLS